MFNPASLDINPQILRLIARLDEFKGTWRVSDTDTFEPMTSLRRVATIQSVGSSTRIEGSRLSDAAVEKLLARLDLKRFETRDEQEVAGYAETMELVSRSWQEITPTENHIRQLHRDLLRYSEKDLHHRGDYKKQGNSVAAFNDAGKQVAVVFETASPFDTPRLTQEAVQWLEAETKNDLLHPLLLIAIFIVVFLEIHPFQDGNGRLSRILTTLLLLRAGYTFTPYSSLERVIEQNKEGYYLALRQTQATIRSGEPDWQPWVLFFLRSLQQQVTPLMKVLEQGRSAFTSMPRISAQIMAEVQQNRRVTMSEMVERTGTSRNTLKQHFRRLVQDGHVVLYGNGRGAWYSVPQ